MGGRHALMRAGRGRCPVSMMARLPGVSRSGHCSRLGAGGRPDPPAEPKDAVAALWEGGGRTSGRRRAKAGLPPERSGASGRSALKGMRELGARGFRPRAAKRTAAPGPGAPARPDLVRRRLNPPVPATVPCGDVAYLKTGEGRLCLAPAVDLSTRMVAGRSFSARMTADIRVPAPEMAERRGCVAGGVVSRSDRGPQHAGAAPAGRAAAGGVRPSVGRTGCRRDDAAAEGLRASLKRETCRRRAFETRKEAETARIDWIERSYNRSRPHSAIGYRHPADLMAEFQDRTEAMFKEESYLAA